MKLIHLSDLHIGKRVNEIHRIIAFLNYIYQQNPEPNSQKSKHRSGGEVHRSVLLLSILP